MIELAPHVVTLLREAGAHEQDTEHGVAWITVDSGVVLRERDGLVDVLGWSKGRTGPPVLTGATRPGLEAFLVLHFGNSWRARHGLSRLGIDLSTDLPPGFVVQQEPGGSERLIMEGPPRAEFGALLRWTGARLAHALVVPLDELVDSYRHPTGHPLFPQG